MSYEERAFKYCQECKFFKECCWSLQGRYADCIDGHTFMDGWEAGQTDTLEEIEKCMDEKYAITSFHRVKDKIKELKEK